MPSVSSHGVDIHYEARGSGPAMVFAHGAGGNVLSWWQQVPHFSRAHRVVSIDHRGFGRSTCSADQFLPERFGDDLCAVLDAEKIDRAALICQSMGGWTGMQMALQRPERVRCLVLGGTPGGVMTPEVVKSFVQIGARARDEGMVANAALAPGLGDRDPERAYLYDIISGLNSGLPPEAVQRVAATQVDAASLARFTTPTLMLAGHEDQLFSIEAMREVAQMIPGAELREFPGIGHSFYFEDAQRFNEIIGTFVAANP